MEIARQLTWSQADATMSHYRTKDGVEVDIVLENRSGEVIGIEVKASSTPTPDDFRGLRHLADRVGDDFLAGYVLHTRYPHLASRTDDARGPARRPRANPHLSTTGPLQLVVTKR